MPLTVPVAPFVSAVPPISSRSPACGLVSVTTPELMLAESLSSTASSVSEIEMAVPFSV